MQYRITRAYPDGVDEDYRIDAFDVEGLGRISLDTAIAWYDAGSSFVAGNGLMPAQVIVKTHPTSLRRYMTTIPDGVKSNNLSTLAYPALGSAIANALRGYR